MINHSNGGDRHLSVSDTQMQKSQLRSVSRRAGKMQLEILTNEKPMRKLEFQTFLKRKKIA